MLRLPYKERMHDTALAEIEACYALGWTDGLPVVPPTPERVEAMLGAWAPRRAEPIATLLPSGGVATVEKIAANAVMAGCLPEFLPVVIGAVQAVAQPEFGLEAVLTTVHSCSPMLLVSGPVAAKLAMNAGTGVLGPGNRANATIGRALLLVMRNVAGAIPGGLDPATLGQPGKYSFCYTEQTTASPWEPFQVTKGFGAEESAVTVYGADAPLCIAEMGRPDPESILTTIVESALTPGSYNAFFREDLFLIMSPNHAEVIGSAGWSRVDVQQYFYERARLPAGQLRQRGLYGFAEVPDYANVVMEADAKEPVPILASPERLCLTVAGGAYGGYTAIVFGMGSSVTLPVPAA